MALPAYYSDLPKTLSSKFQNLDETSTYLATHAALKSGATKNFIVDFGGAHEAGGQAWVAVDVDPVEDMVGIGRLLDKVRPASLRTRWINIFAPYEQADLVATITHKYGFSPRLTKVITTPPRSPPPATPTSRPSSTRRLSRIFHRGDSGRSRDIELQLPGGATLQVPPGADAHEMHRMAQAAQLAGTNYMDLAMSVWHWHAVEWGNSYICTGFNHLHNVPAPPAEKGGMGMTGAEWGQTEEEEEVFDTGNYNPEGRRVWSWLILCDDGTVISIHEPLTHITPEDLIKVRRNQLGVLRSLSLSPAAQKNSIESLILGGGLDDLPFRVQGPANTPRYNENVDAGPSLLLYYLFDDWHSIYRFVRLRGDPYSTEMRRLRNDMHKDPNLSHLASLNRLTRQLAMLKRMYETRKIILENVLYRQENAQRKLLRDDDDTCRRASSGDYESHITASTATTAGNPYMGSMGSPDILGVTLSTLAVAKFERLRDRIRLYILGELDALLVEKTELENLTFNLISLKQSQTVEVLTRVTIWLAAFTVLFLPLTLVTGYFSMQLRDVVDAYSSRTFWGAAGVSVAVTLLVLYTVGKSTKTVQAKEVVKAFKKVWLGWMLKREGKKKLKKSEGGEPTVKIE